MPSTIFMWTRRKRKIPTVEYHKVFPGILLADICDLFKCNYVEVVSRCRRADLVMIRAIYVYFCRKMDFNTTETGLWIGRDHCTVTYLHKKVKAMNEVGKPWSNKDCMDMIEVVRLALSRKYNLSL